MSSAQWHDLICVKNLEVGDVTPVSFRGKDLAVYDGSEKLSVSDAKCTHAGANLCDGYFNGRHIECPLHQGLFDVVTGQAKSAPVVKALTMYECRVREGRVQILLYD